MKAYLDILQMTVSGFKYNFVRIGLWDLDEGQLYDRVCIRVSEWEQMVRHFEYDVQIIDPKVEIWNGNRQLVLDPWTCTVKLVLFNRVRPVKERQLEDYRHIFSVTLAEHMYVNMTLVNVKALIELAQSNEMSKEM